MHVLFSLLFLMLKYSLLYLAEHRLGLKPVEGDVPIDSLDRFVEAGACGTAAVISPIGGIQHAFQVQQVAYSTGADRTQ